MNTQEKADFLLKNYPEMLDFVDVIIKGAEKYAMDNWLIKDGNRMSLQENTDSIFHHLAAASRGEMFDESGLNHFLHIACRVLMGYTRTARHIYHPKDYYKAGAYVRYQVKAEFDDSKCYDINDVLSGKVGHRPKFYADDRNLKDKE